MDKQLNEQVSTCVQTAGVKMADYDVRSAIGLARAWVDSSKLDVWHSEKVKMIEIPERDRLAKDMVEILRGASRSDCITALGRARALVNAPFLDPSMLGFRARRAKQGLVGSEKKNEKLAKA